MNDNRVVGPQQRMNDPFYDKSTIKIYKTGRMRPYVMNCRM